METYLQNAIINTANLNVQFENHVKNLNRLSREAGTYADMNADQYLETASDIYRNHDNFLVNMPNAIPIEVADFYKPFKVLQKTEIKDYIESSFYLANEVGIIALCSKLALNIIPIERVENQGVSNLRIPFANFSNGINRWTKYLFLYYYGGHYELITFSYVRKTPPKLGSTTGFKNTLKTAVIYDIRDHNIIPPIYILVLIYGSYYSQKSDAYKQQFTFFPDLMKKIEAGYNNIIATNYENDNQLLDRFNLYFNTTFPGRNLSNVASSATPAVPLIENSPSPPPPSPPQAGGLYRNSNPYNRPYSNPYNKPAYKMEKTGEKDNSNISYYITIDMELQPGLTLTPKELKESQCRQKWNSVRKAYAGFTGQPYVIKPLYQMNKTTKNKEEQSTNKNNTQKGGLRRILKTRKNKLYTLSSKKRKTIKNT